MIFKIILPYKDGYVKNISIFILTFLSNAFLNGQLYQFRIDTITDTKINRPDPYYWNCMNGTSNDGSIFTFVNPYELPKSIIIYNQNKNTGQIDSQILKLNNRHNKILYKTGIEGIARYNNVNYILYSNALSIYNNNKYKFIFLNKHIKNTYWYRIDQVENIVVVSGHFVSANTPKHIALILNAKNGKLIRKIEIPLPESTYFVIYGKWLAVEKDILYAAIPQQPYILKTNYKSKNITFDTLSIHNSFWKYNKLVGTIKQNKANVDEVYNIDTSYFSIKFIDISKGVPFAIVSNNNSLYYINNISQNTPSNVFKIRDYHYQLDSTILFNNNFTYPLFQTGAKSVYFNRNINKFVEYKSGIYKLPINYIYLKYKINLKSIQIPFNERTIYSFKYEIDH